MPDADRRVPTAADVERWGEWWWYINVLGKLGTVRLYVMDGFLYAADRRYASVGDLDGTWLGPVNPEPLPWPNSP